MRSLAPRLALTLVLLAAACGGGYTAVEFPTPGTDAALGVSFDTNGAATFQVWAPAAPSVSLLFFTSSTSATPSATTPMAKVLAPSGAGAAPAGSRLDQGGWNGVWTVTVPGVASGQLYQYLVGGTRALDPYAPSMGQFDSSNQTVGMGAAVDMATLGPLDAAGAPTAWSDFTAPNGYSFREEAVIYEIHVRDATIKLTGLANPPGTYRAFTEGNVLQHIRDLGATHVQLLPVLAYYNGNESQRSTIETGPGTTHNNYNWGYDPQGYFAPDGMYSTTPTAPVLRVQELMTLVNEAHKAGLGVTLDVVYNHTVDSSIFEPLAPGYYYRSSSFSGAGPDLATERRMVRKLVVDSIAHWTRHYKVDGFRFDLMGLLDSKTIADAYAAAAAINPNVLFIGEGWRMGSLAGSDDQGNAIVPANQDWMIWSDQAAVFSDSFRNVIKGGGLNEGRDNDAGFVTLAATDPVTLIRNLRGDATNFTASTPGDAVQYLTAHDGLTLHDKIGKILRLGAADPAIHRVARLAFALQATSQGIVFIHAGCEFGRSKRVPGPAAESTASNAGDGSSYVSNSYDASDDVNGIDWGLLAAGSEGARLSAYVQGLLALRRSSDAFHLGSKALAASNVTLLDGSRANAIAYQVTDLAGSTHLSVFVNAGTGSVTLASGTNLVGKDVIVDRDTAGTTAIAGTPVGVTVAASTVTLLPRTAAVIRW
jgi:pullulanase